MSFPPIEYVEWIEGRPDRADYDLATSDLHGRHEAKLLDRIDGAPLDRHDDRGDTSTLREAIASIYGVDPKRVLVTAGATAATFLAIATALDDADHLLAERPGYEAHVATPRGLGATVERFDRRPEPGYDVDPARIEAACTRETGAVVLTNRHNPSGRALAREELADAAAVARRAGARLLVDEVYAPYSTDSPDAGPFGGVTAAGLDGAVITSSLTKFYGYGGLRIGWLIADEPFVERARSIAVHLPTVADPSRRLAAIVLDRHDEETAAARALHEQHAELLSSFVADRPSIDAPAAGCSFGFLSHETATGSQVFEAADDEGVLVVPGRFFGDDDRFRVSLGGTPDEMATALDALADVLDSL